MITRKQYMLNHTAAAGDRAGQRQAFRDFYAQFVSDAGRNHVVSMIGGDKLLASTDEHLNDIPLRRWDRVGQTMPLNYNRLREAGLKGLAPSDYVCIAKEAARQFIEENQE